MHVAIINHEHTAAALALKAAFAPHAEVLALDSGSNLTTAERSQFDLALPNVYYSGLLNAVAESTAGLDDNDVVYLWSSDVSHGDYAAAVSRAREAFLDPGVGTYAPSAWFSGHRQMWNKRTGGLRPVTFVEGFCFATRAGVLRRLCPVDTSVNALGWAVDIQLGYLTRRSALRTVVDDRLEVRHPRSTGYSTRAAALQRRAWLAQLPAGARRFHRVASWTWTKRRPFAAWISSLRW